MPKSDTNPKTRFGAAKPGISAIPPVALLHLGRGMEDGENKYGLTNWRENEVSASVYYNAAFRHLAAWWDGEQDASDSGVHHLGHVMACCAILLDAEAQGKLNDDRPAIPGAFARMVKEMTRALVAPEEPRAVDIPFEVRIEPEESVVKALFSLYLATDPWTYPLKCRHLKEVMDAHGADSVSKLDAEGRTCVAFYLDCALAGVDNTLPEMYGYLVVNRHVEPGCWLPEGSDL